MQIKRQELEQLVEAIRGELQDHTPASLTAALEAMVLGNRLLRSLPPDPVDAVPVQDYPFPWPKGDVQ